MRDYVDLPPLEVVGASGCLLELGDGRKLFDAISSWWCKSLGHGHPRLQAALRTQLERFEHVMVAGFTHEPLVWLCERLLAAGNGAGPEAFGPDAPPGRPPGHFGRVFLADNGSTGVEVALKMALQAQAQSNRPERNRFAAFANGYHGETVGALSVSDLGLYGDPYRALMFPVDHLADLPYRRGPADPRWMDPEPEWTRMKAALDRLAPTLAAVVYEPVLQAAGNMRFYSPALLDRLTAWARDNQVFLIADELAAGFGRLGAMLASHLARPEAPAAALPDFAVVSKGLTGGTLPLSAVLTTHAIYRLFDADYFERRAFLHSNTHTGNALAVAVALAALDVYALEDVLGQVQKGTPVLAEAMTALAARRPFVREIRAAGMVAAIDLAAPDGSALPPKRRMGYDVYRQGLARGALLRPLGDTMYILPPLNTSPADLQTMVAILAESLDAAFATP